VIRDRQQNILRISLSGDEKYRIWTPLESLPKDYIKATLLMEDQYFYYHPGFNPIALVRSFISSISSKQNTPGASTITMQLVRLRYGLKTKSILGKLKQIFLVLIKFTS
jgi:penicillin-binding protein 1C